MAKLKTGRHTSALKAHRQSDTHAKANKEIRSKIRSLARQVEEAVVKKDAVAAKKLLSETFSMWDKAAKVGVIHDRSASRKKSRLSGKVAALGAAKA
jgi:small subunit ribosomal protein S20